MMRTTDSNYATTGAITKFIISGNPSTPDPAVSLIPEISPIVTEIKESSGSYTSSISAYQINLGLSVAGSFGAVKYMALFNGDYYDLDCTLPNSLLPSEPSINTIIFRCIKNGLVKRIKMDALNNTITILPDVQIYTPYSD